MTKLLLRRECLVLRPYIDFRSPKDIKSLEKATRDMWFWRRARS